jgi:hypothetical protein
LHEAFSLEDVVNFVGSLMLMCWLFLARFETINVAEHALGFKEIDLLELLGYKALAFGDIYPSHGHPPLQMIP